MNFLEYLTVIAEAYDTLAKGGAKPTADKLLAGVVSFLGALQTVQATTAAVAATAHPLAG